jgi:hypothetical protein
LFKQTAKRLRSKSKKTLDVYQYDAMPEPLRIQIIHIWHDVIGNPHSNAFDQNIFAAYDGIVKILRRENGVLSLVKNNPKVHDNGYSYNELIEYFGTQKDVDKVLDVLELGCLTIDKVIRGPPRANEKWNTCLGQFRVQVGHAHDLIV